MRPDLVIFDCDGVLVDTEMTSNRAIARYLTRHGVSVTAEETLALFGGGTIRSIGEGARARGALLPNEWLDELYAEIFEELSRGVAVIPGVVGLLDQLEATGVPVAVASNAPMRKMEITLGPSGLWQRLQHVILSSHDHAPKPDPSMLHVAMSRIGARPERSVMIDDMWSGCTAAQRAGIRCFGYVADGDPARIDGTGATPVRAMSEIAAALDLS